MKTKIAFAWPQNVYAMIAGKYWHVMAYYDVTHRIGVFIEISLTDFGIIVHVGIINFSFWIGKTQGTCEDITQGSYKDVMR